MSAWFEHRVARALRAEVPLCGDERARRGVMERVRSAANADTVGRALGGVLGGAQLIFGTLLRALTVLVLTIYFLAYFDKLRALAYALVPRSRRQRVAMEVPFPFQRRSRRQRTNQHR